MRTLGNGADFWRVLLTNSFHMENLAVAPGCLPCIHVLAPVCPMSDGFLLKTFWQRDFTNRLLEIQENDISQQICGWRVWGQFLPSTSHV